MSATEEIARLRRLAAEMVEESVRRGSPLSPAEDAEILALLKQAQELETHGKPDTKPHYPIP